MKGFFCFFAYALALISASIRADPVNLYNPDADGSYTIPMDARTLQRIENEGVITRQNPGKVQRIGPFVGAPEDEVGEANGLPFVPPPPPEFPEPRAMSADEMPAPEEPELVAQGGSATDCDPAGTSGAARPDGSGVDTSLRFVACLDFHRRLDAFFQQSPPNVCQCNSPATCAPIRKKLKVALFDFLELCERELSGDVAKIRGQEWNAKAHAAIAKTCVSDAGSVPKGESVLTKGTDVAFQRAAERARRAADHSDRCQAKASTWLEAAANHASDVKEFRRRCEHQHLRIPENLAAISEPQVARLESQCGSDASEYRALQQSSLESSDSVRHALKDMKPASSSMAKNAKTPAPPVKGLEAKALSLSDVMNPLPPKAAAPTQPAASRVSHERQQKALRSTQIQ